MSHRRNTGSLLMGAVGAAWLVVTAAACSKPVGTEQRKSESTTQTSAGEVKTTSESTRVGETLQAKTETKADTPGGKIAGKVETVIGTVTAYEPGKKIEVLTAEKKTRGFSLDAKDTFASVDPGVAVGSRVKLTEQTGDDKSRRVTVKVEG